MKQLREGVLYIVFGVLTTIVNYIVYFYCRSWDLHYIASNVISFLVAVLFAFITNKYLVFGQHEKHHLLSEFLSFLTLRLVSMAIETALLFVGVEWLLVPDGIMKLACSVLTVILNYGFSKWITFARKE